MFKQTILQRNYTNGSEPMKRCAIRKIQIKMQGDREMAQWVRPLAEQA